MCVCVSVCVHARTSAIRVVESLAQAIHVVDLVVAVILCENCASLCDIYEVSVFINLPGRDTRARISTRATAAPTVLFHPFRSRR